MTLYTSNPPHHLLSTDAQHDREIVPWLHSALIMMIDFKNNDDEVFALMMMIFALKMMNSRSPWDLSDHGCSWHPPAAPTGGA